MEDNTLNTLLFQDDLECQYFIEDMVSRGFRIDNANSHTKATTYYHKGIPGMKVVVNVGNKTADLYHNDKLIENT
jgi:hypothetical protein